MKSTQLERDLLLLLQSAGEFMAKMIVEGKLYNIVSPELYHEAEDFVDDFIDSIKRIQKEQED